MPCGKFLSFARTVAFRLSLWYAAVFTGSILVSFVIFYAVLHHGIRQVQLSPRSLHELLEIYRSFFGVALSIAAAVSLFVGWFMAKRALAGVGQVTDTAISIAGTDMSRRVPVKGTSDEIDRLAVAFNDMLERISTVLQSMKEITDSIAHDLRSPITRMRGVAEMALSGSEGGESVAMAGTIVEECDRLLAMINTTLDISEVEAGLAKLRFQKIDLVELLRDVCDLFEPVAEDKGIHLQADFPDGVVVFGDLSRLQRVFANLLDNALKYTPTGGRVRVSAAGDERDGRVTIEDTGCGIPNDELPHVFDRFFRGEKSRSTQGNGLGLSLAYAVVVAHGGSILADSAPGAGTRFTVNLPTEGPSRPEGR